MSNEEAQRFGASIQKGWDFSLPNPTLGIVTSSRLVRKLGKYLLSNEKFRGISHHFRMSAVRPTREIEVTSPPIGRVGATSRTVR